MKNILRNFYNLCGGEYIGAIVLNNLYCEASQHTRGDYSIIIDFFELKEDLNSIVWKWDECRMVDIFISLQEGLEILNYDYINEAGEKVEWGSSEIIRCTVNVQAIDIRLDKCRIESEKVKKNNRRAINLKLPATLTAHHWIRTLNDVNWRCIYCLEDYEVLEHIIPLPFPDSGTTIANCVPSCYRCKGLKGAYHPNSMPDDIQEKMGESIERARRWAHGNEVDLGLVS